MAIQSFTAEGLFEWVVNKESFLLLDVRNEEEFGRFKVEGPHPIEMVNVPYMEFIEHEEESVAKVPKGDKVRVERRPVVFDGQVMERGLVRKLRDKQ